MKCRECGAEMRAVELGVFHPYWRCDACGYEEAKSAETEEPGEERRLMAVTKDEHETIVRWLVRCLDAASHFGGGQKLLPLCERLVEGDLRWGQLETAGEK